MRPVSTGDALRHEAEPQALPRLKARRVVVVACEPRQAEALAEELRASGANAVALGGPDSDLEAALALDADAILALEPDPSGAMCEPIVDALRGHPRACWASVVRIASEALESEPTRSVALVAIASHVVEAAAAGVELAVRAKGKLPHTTQLQPLGMNRVLRVLADTHRTLRVELSGSWGLATLDLHDRRVLGVRVERGGSDPVLSDAQALAALLAVPDARLRIESGGKPARRWNVDVPAALARAAALAHPELPRIAWPRTEPSPEHEVSAPSRPPDAAEYVPERVLDGTESGTRQRSDLEVTRETPLRELIECVEASRTPLPAPELTPSAPDRPSRSRGKLIASACIAALVAAITVTFLMRIDLGVQHGARRPSGHEGQRQREAPSIAAPTLAPTPMPNPAAEPAAAGAPAAAAASAVPLLRDEESGQLRDGQLLVKRARRERRAGRLDRAEASYLEAVAKLPHYPLAMAGLARVYLERKNGVEAVRWAEQLVMLQPNRDSHQLLLGDAYALRGNRAEAEQAWRQAKQLGNKTARIRLEAR